MPILAIEVFNILWAVTGTIFSRIYGNEDTNLGALRDCTRDYGLGTNLMAGVFMVLGYV
jgi:hypothetical protein